MIFQRLLQLLILFFLDLTVGKRPQVKGRTVVKYVKEIYRAKKNKKLFDLMSLMSEQK